MRHGVGLLALLAICAAAAHAQPTIDTTGRWGLLRPVFPQTSGPPDTIFFGVFFRDELHGYVNSRWETSDGGVTWGPLTRPYPGPHVFPYGRFGAALERVSVDSGASWTSMRFTPTGDAFKEYYHNGTWFTAATPKRAYYLPSYKTEYFDTFEDREEQTQYRRLVTTTDGGVTWTPADSLAPTGLSSAPSPVSANGFGMLPHPPGMVNPRHWIVALPHIADSTIVELVTSVYPIKQFGVHDSRYYWGRLNITTGAVTWSEIPVLHGMDPERTETYFYRGAPHEIYAHYYNGNPYQPDHVVGHSTDDGAHWDSIPLPDWLSRTDLTFLPGGVVASFNGVTSDAGLTWRRFGNPLMAAADAPVDGRPVGEFTATTASHFFAWSPTIFAWSTDGGRTWSRNHGHGSTTAIATAGSRVVMAWDGRAITTTNDGGATWHDAGSTVADVPPQLSWIAAMAFPDPAASPDSIIAIGRCIDDSTQYSALVTSGDGGITWRESARLPGLDDGSWKWDHATIRPRLTFHRAAGGGRVAMLCGEAGLLASTDDGRTWEKRGPGGLNTIAMSGADRGIGVALLPPVQTMLMYTTTDGWRTWKSFDGQDWWRFLGLSAFGGTGTGDGELRLLYTDRDYRARADGTALDAIFSEYPAEPAPSEGPTHRLDAMRIYGVSGTNWYYSDNGGHQYALFPVPQGLQGHVTKDFSVLGDSAIYQSGTTGVVFFRLSKPVLSVDRDRTGGIGVGVSQVGNDRLTLQYALAARTRVAVTVVDLLGRVVGGEEQGMQEAGDHQADIAIGDLPSGRYMLVVHAGGVVRSMPVAIVR